MAISTTQPRPNRYGRKICRPGHLRAPRYLPARAKGDEDATSPLRALSSSSDDSDDDSSGSSTGGNGNGGGTGLCVVNRVVWGSKAMGFRRNFKSLSFLCFLSPRNPRHHFFHRLGTPDPMVVVPG